MEEQKYTVDVWIDAETFRRFSIFNSITKDKRWIRPAVFLVIFCVLAAVCFIFQKYAQQAPLMGLVLLVIGLGLPMVYFGTYFYTLARRTEQLKLKDKKQHAYCVTLTNEADGVKAVTPKGEERTFSWKEAVGAYRAKDAIYLYVEAGRVYILPDEYTGEQREGIWALIKAQMPAGKVKVL